MSKKREAKTNSSKLATASSASEEALEWFTRLTDTPVNASLRLKFLNWCAEHPENKQAYQQISALWGSDVFSEALQIDEQRLKQAAFVNTRNFVSGLAVAATLLLGIWGVFQSGLIQRLSADRYTTVGQQQTMILADGTRVLLDTDSAITVSYNDHSRNITLLMGRAFFNVRPNTLRPFIVNTNHERIRVVGTRFTVNSIGNRPLTVQQGVVAYQGNNIDRETTVIGGEQLEKNLDQVSVIETDPATSAFAWTDGRLKFSNQRLGNIMTEIDRYQPGIIVISKQKLADIRVTGNYKLSDPEKIIASLAQITDAKIGHVSDYLTVLY